MRVIKSASYEKALKKLAKGDEKLPVFMQQVEQLFQKNFPGFPGGMGESLKIQIADGVRQALKNTQDGSSLSDPTITIPEETDEFSDIGNLNDQDRYDSGSTFDETNPESPFTVNAADPLGSSLNPNNLEGKDVSEADLGNPDWAPKYEGF